MAFKPYVKQANDQLVEIPLCAEQLGTNTVGSTNEPIYLDGGVPKKCTSLKEMIVDLIYPVGSYFITESSEFDTVTKVKNHFGGNWTRVEGRFLYGSNSAGSSGGSNDAKVISHSHTFTGNAQSGSAYISRPSNGYIEGTSGIVSGRDWKGWTFGTQGAWSDGGYSGFNINFTPSGSISTEGSSGTNANMPAYRTVYMYRRTA